MSKEFNIVWIKLITASPREELGRISVIPDKRMYLSFG